MAYTKIHAIKQTLGKALDYIENPDKTDGSLLVSGYNVEPECASMEMTITQIQALNIKGNRVQVNQSANLAYHMIQSFSPADEVTPEQAHELGRRLADELLQGAYEYVVATHIDKGHIHNHIIFNATSFLDYKKYRTNPQKTAKQIREISDQLCADAGLSIIKPTQIGKAYRYAPYKASYKTQIRRRIRVALEAATTWEEYQDALKAIGVSITKRGSTTSYALESQQRATRSDSLGKNGEYLDTAIQERLEANRTTLAQLKDRIEQGVDDARSYDQFVAGLAERGVGVTKVRNGEVRYTIGDVTVNEWSLGSAYSTDSITKAIDQGRGLGIFADEDDVVEMIVKKFESIDRPIREAVPVKISAQRVLRTVVDGILVAVPGEPGGNVFIAKNNIAYDPGTDQYTIAIAAGFSYTLKKDDGTTINKQGEDIIRTLERAESVPPQILELPAEDIISISTKGVMCAVPELGIKKIFIPSEFVEYNQFALGGQANVAIWKNWSYSFTDINGRQKYLSGDDLIAALSVHKDRMENSLSGRIKAVQKKSVLAETKAMADMLNRLRKEGINQMDDFDVKITALLARSDELRQKISGLEDKMTQYRRVVKYLTTVQELEPVELDMKLLRLPKRKAEYQRNHAKELGLLQRAREELKNLNVDVNVDPAKVEELIRQYAREVASISDVSQELKNRVIALQQAKNAVETIVEPQEAKDGRRQNGR